MSPWLCPAACSGQEWLQEGQRGLKAALVPPAGRGSTCSATKGQQRFRCPSETGVLWRGKHAGRGCARVSLQGGRRGRQDRISAAAGWVGPEPSTRPLFQRGKVSWIVARESKLPNFPLCGPSHLADSSAERLINTFLVLWETFFFYPLQHR